ncbi:MAG TPA: 4Fe-4S double cluster binding domain-containing protein [Clostridia bacterium]|nr:4Fe-4S double cluster binding domain-containing protein [Clostridia bacterium]
MQSQITKELISERAFQLGANLCGVGDLTADQAFIQENYGDYCAHFPRAVSVAIFFPKEIIHEQQVGPTHSYEYFYNTLNRQLDNIGLIISVMLQNAGYRAYPVPTSDYRQDARGENLQKLVAENHTATLPRIGTERMGMFSHRLAAREAGFGWIGKSCNLINPTVGPCLRLTTVLTDAPLPADSPVPNRCGSCTRCRDACPAKAISGRLFNPAESVTDRLDRGKCYGQLQAMGQVFGQSTCALCLAVCPWGH